MSEGCIWYWISFQTNFLENINGLEDGDSSDAEESDVEDDVEHGSESEDEDEGNDSGEADSLDEDEIEDVSEDEEQEEAEEGSSEDEDSFGDDDEEEEDDKNEEENESINKTKASEVKLDRDSGIDDPPQAKVKLKKVKSKLIEKHKQTSVIEDGDNSTATPLSSTATSLSTTPLNITPAPSVPDEYEEDSSDEEDLRNTIGRLNRRLVVSN